MPEMRYTAKAEDEGRTVKSVALRTLRLSRGLFSSLKFSGGILLDGETARADARIREGQELTFCWRDGAAPSLIPCDAPFDIPYADEHYFILDKPAPLPTLCSAHQAGPTLENALYRRLSCPEDFVFRPVNRLDKGTSGLLAAARDAHAQHLLQRQLHTDAFIREYQAVCLGRLPEKSGVIDLPIGKEESGIRRRVTPSGARAVTRYRVEEETENYSLVRLRLETGRTHQIRVHLAALACPVLGDYLYGQADERLPGRFALHSCALCFTHPFTGETVRAASALPPELAALLEGDRR